jgi:hypothetical protein
MKHTNFHALLERMPQQLRKKIEELSFDVVDESAKRFVHSSGLRFKAADWQNGHMPSQVVLEGDVSSFEMFEPSHSTTHFTPFVEKIRVPQGSKICTLGDIHGDIWYLINVLEELQRQGYLDEEYKITNPEFYLAFVGDYTNRNPHSVEVMLTIFYIHRQNLGRVFLLRGNHEYAISTRITYDMYQILHRDQNPAALQQHSHVKDVLIAEMSRKFSLYNFPDLLYWFDFLPMAVYIGCFDDVSRQFNYITLCHGGIEPGFSSAALLQGKARFELIKNLDRYSVMRKLVQDKVLPDAENRLKFVYDVIAQKGLTSFAQSFSEAGHVVDLGMHHEPRQLRLGMQWNSFLTESNDAISIASSKKHRNFLFGRALTEYFFAQGSTPEHRLISMIRGHQHLDELDPEMGLNSPMLTQLRASNGLVRQWDGALYTMGDGGSATGWQSFMIITTGKVLSDWTYTHYFRSDIYDSFEQKTTVFFGK